MLTFDLKRQIVLRVIQNSEVIDLDQVEARAWLTSSFLMCLSELLTERGSYREKLKAIVNQREIDLKEFSVFFVPMLVEFENSFETGDERHDKILEIFSIIVSAMYDLLSEDLGFRLSLRIALEVNRTKKFGTPNQRY